MKAAVAAFVLAVAVFGFAVAGGHLVSAQPEAPAPIQLGPADSTDGTVTDHRRRRERSADVEPEVVEPEVDEYDDTDDYLDDHGGNRGRGVETTTEESDDRGSDSGVGEPERRRRWRRTTMTPESGTPVTAVAAAMTMPPTTGADVPLTTPVPGRPTATAEVARSGSGPSAHREPGD